MRLLLASAAIAAVLATPAAAQHKTAAQPIEQQGKATTAASSSNMPVGDLDGDGTLDATGKKHVANVKWSSGKATVGTGDKGAQKNAINTKGTGTTKRTTAPNDGQATDPNGQQKAVLKTRTKSNQSNE